MRILIDECVDQRLRFLFPGHDCETAAFAKLSGLKNGALLAAAEAAGFEVIVTTEPGDPLSTESNRSPDFDDCLVRSDKQARRSQTIGSGGD
ncbi:MAG: hypothetical protein JOY54_16215 [Acidobacteriaceae bacterium]|nr:hypothetical protein [Acidobacteriaceae bacterium]